MVVVLESDSKMILILDRPVRFYDALITMARIPPNTPRFGNS